jgi:hypothetical protein
MELSRLLRRGLLVAAIAAGGWLLSVAFASTASADEAPPNTTQTHSGGLLGGLVNGLSGALGGVTTTVTGITESLVDTSGDLQQPDPAQDVVPIVDLPSLVGGSSSGSASTDRLPPLDESRDLAPATPVVVPPPPAVVPPPVPTPLPETPVAVVPPAPAAPPAAPAPDSTGSDQAGGGVPEPQPVKTPTTPATSGTTMSSAHDNPGGARSTHGVLPAQTTFHPADAGFTTRSRAVNAAGRVAGLPASSPD